MTTATENPTKTIAVTIVGALTVLWSGCYASIGGILIVGATRLFAESANANDPPGGLAEVGHWLGSIMAGVATVIGIALLIAGGMGLLAGLGVLCRKQWGRIATFIPAIMAVSWGLFLIGVIVQGNAEEQAVPYIGIGAIHLLYGVFTIVILSRNGAEFTRSPA